MLYRHRRDIVLRIVICFLRPQLKCQVIVSIQLGNMENHKENTDKDIDFHLQMPSQNNEFVMVNVNTKERMRRLPVEKEIQMIQYNTIQYNITLFIPITSSFRRAQYIKY